MHSDEANNIISANVPAFLIKLWRLVNDHNYDSLIGWSENGNTFQVHNQVTFAQEILPMYFKHNNFTSFVRQLNMYGFRKMVGSDKGSLKAETTGVWEFHNLNFRRGHPELLEYVKRKINPSEEKKLKPEVYEKVLTDLQQVQGKQELMSQSFDDLKGQNQTMWSEIMDLRQKHRKQQIVINKLIHFIYNMISQSSLGISNKRLMMPERDTHSPKRPRLSQQIVPASTSQPSILEMPDSPIIAPPLSPSSAGFDLPHEENFVLPQLETLPLPVKSNPPQLKLLMPTTTNTVSLTTPTIPSSDLNPASALFGLDTVPHNGISSPQLTEPVLDVSPITTTVEASSMDMLGNPRLVAGDYCDEMESSIDGLHKLLGTIEYNIDPSTLSNLFDENDYVVYPHQDLLEALNMSDKDTNETTSGLQLGANKDKVIHSQSNQEDESNKFKYGQNAIEWPFGSNGESFENSEDHVSNLDLPLEIFQS